MRAQNAQDHARATTQSARAMRPIVRMYGVVLKRCMERIGRVPRRYEPMPIIARTVSGGFAIRWQAGTDKHEFKERACAQRHWDQECAADTISEEEKTHEDG